uniref:Photosystem I subunit H n=1 Tax=Mesostigma viride TaxID=41882 RepID=A0A7S5CEE2_MESVI|eukprot:jgi/Mesvir1/5190/Mv15323-RA.1
MASALATSVSASTFAGKSVKLNTAAKARVAARAPVVAKYGDKNVYFDLKDMEQTTGKWDLYGQDSPERYPAMQADFFNRAAGDLTRRESILTFVTYAGVGAIALFGAKGAKDAKLPITVGPQKPAAMGPRGRL